ncbi:claudin-23 [Dasypus novemcinctus]|uniref:claudin-23 n=1 Tax=Dasypus novemcinctus TaxID=9361 RepID=UPI00265F24BB|nr:claudin-23 [Dasypus novemcinctus]
MRTPAAMTLGLVLAPCGLLLNLTATLAPGWRQLKGFLDQPVDVVLVQGLWDVCREQSSRERECGLQDAWGYLAARPVLAARALLPTSLATTGLGLLLAALGVRCWRDEPRRALAGFSGAVLGAAGLLGLVAVSWYAHFLQDRDVLPAPPPPVTAQASYSLVLGFLGSCLGLLGGLALALSCAPWCAEHCCRRRGGAGSARRSSVSTLHVEWPEPPLAPAIKAYGAGQHLPRPAEPRAAARRVGFPMPRPPPRAYTNPADVLEGERGHPAGGAAPPGPASLPCDSDL